MSSDETLIWFKTGLVNDEVRVYDNVVANLSKMG